MYAIKRKIFLLILISLSLSVGTSQGSCLSELWETCKQKVREYPSYLKERYGSVKFWLDKGVFACESSVRRKLYAYFQELWDSQRQKSRLSGAIPYPELVTDEISVVPETVPDAIHQRIDKLRRGVYDWSASKPILLVGMPGTGKSKSAEFLAQQTGCPLSLFHGSNFLSSKGNSGVENVYHLFKNAYHQSIFDSYKLSWQRLKALFLMRQLPVQKPAIICVDEIDGIATPIQTFSKNDDLFESERSRTCRRLALEIMISSSFLKDHVSRGGFTCESPSLPAASALGKFYDEGHFFIRRELCRLNYKLCQKSRIYNKIVNSRIADWFFSSGRIDPILIATTNKRVGQLDPELMRYFEVVQMRPLDVHDRLAILNFHMRGKPFADYNILTDLSGATEGYSGADLVRIVNNAGLNAAIRRANIIELQDFEMAFEKMEREKNRSGHIERRQVLI